MCRKSVREGTYHRNLVGMSKLRSRSQSISLETVDDIRRIVQGTRSFCLRGLSSMARTYLGYLNQINKCREYCL